MLDTNYDRRSVFPRQVFFPMADKETGWGKLAKSLRAELEEGLVDKYWGTESEIFRIVVARA